MTLAKYYFNNPSQSVLTFNDLLNSVHVNDKMVCGPKANDDGVAFLIVWLGEPDSYHLKNRNKELLSGYLDRYYSICYFSDLDKLKVTIKKEELPLNIVTTFYYDSKSGSLI